MRGTDRPCACAHARSVPPCPRRQQCSTCRQQPLLEPGGACVLAASPADLSHPFTTQPSDVRSSLLGRKQAAMAARNSRDIAPHALRVFALKWVGACSRQNLRRITFSSGVLSAHYGSTTGPQQQPAVRYSFVCRPYGDALNPPFSRSGRFLCCFVIVATWRWRATKILRLNSIPPRSQSYRVRHTRPVRVHVTHCT
jgi:hypothetical protein